MGMKLFYSGTTFCYIERPVKVTQRECYYNHDNRNKVVRSPAMLNDHPIISAYSQWTDLSFFNYIRFIHWSCVFYIIVIKQYTITLTVRGTTLVVIMTTKVDPRTVRVAIFVMFVLFLYLFIVLCVLVYYMYNRLFVLVAIKPPGLRKVWSVITLSVNTSSKWHTPLSNGITTLIAQLVTKWWQLLFQGCTALYPTYANGHTLICKFQIFLGEDLQPPPPIWPSPKDDYYITANHVTIDNTEIMIK